MRLSRVITAALLTLMALLATAKLSCTVNVGLPQPAGPIAPEAGAGEAPLGLPADWFERSREAYKAFPRPFRAAGAADVDELRRKRVLLWDAVLLAESPRKPKGQHYTSGPQQTDDCVSWATSTAIFFRLASQLQAGESERVEDPFQPFQYGVARVTEGGGQPRCGQGGAYPSYAAAGFCRHGWASYQEAGIAYDRATADRWGCKGPPAGLLAIAKPRAGGSTHPVRTVDECVEAICYRYPVTLGMPWGGRRERPANGFTVTEFNLRASAGHALCIIGYDGQAGDGQFVIQNSHGPTAHAQNAGDPPGSFRVTRRHFEQIVDVSELWAYSDVKGFPAKELDLSGLDDLVLRRAEPPALVKREGTHAVSKRLLAP